MTERIQELIEKASKDFPFTVRAYVPELFLAKFAELIVLECCDIFVERRTGPTDLAVKDVKKHFGVEE